MSELNLSLKVLKNKMYKFIPQYRPGVDKAKNEDDLIGIKLVYAHSGTAVWERNNGIIRLRDMHQDTRDYVISRFVSNEHLKVFSGLGS